MDQQLMFELGDLISKAITLAIAAGIALAVQRVVVKVAKKAFEAADIPNATLFVNVLRAAIWSFALLAILQPVFGIDPTWLVTALGVVSVAVSLGLQDTISNLVGGLGLMLSRSVRPGDYVEVGSTRGVVTDVTWRSTTLRARDGNVDVIPNSVLNKTTLTHLDPFYVGMCSVDVAVRQGADLERVTEDVKESVGAALADVLDPARGIDVFFDSITAYGTCGRVCLHLVDGVPYGSARTRAVKAIHGHDWCANALNN